MHKIEVADKTTIKALPQVPGIYIYKDSLGAIIYVGKAKNLKNRVKSYFASNLDPASKTYNLVQHIESINYIEVSSEIEALILEAALIKKHQPKYNIAMKDDKSYLYIVIRVEKLKKAGKVAKIPKVLAARESDILPSDQYFGPYPSGDTVRKMMRYIRRAFPYRDCSAAKFNKHHKSDTPCLYGFLKLCNAPCTVAYSLVSYRKDIDKIKRFLSGGSLGLVRNISSLMKNASRHQNYELAASYRDDLNRINYIKENFRTAQRYIDNPYLIDDLRSKSLSELSQAIFGKKLNLGRIECYDISNISGTDSVGSMTVAIEGKLEKSEYKRFKIKTKNTPDDFAMLREVLTRRLSREADADNSRSWGAPDLLIIDGGKGQVTAALQAMKDIHFEVPVIGIAKRFETLIVPTSNGFEEVVLEKTNEGLKLVQRLRDEAHRFAQNYHHKLRLKSISKTTIIKT